MLCPLAAGSALIRFPIMPFRKFCPGQPSFFMWLIVASTPLRFLYQRRNCGSARRRCFASFEYMP